MTAASPDARRACHLRRSDHEHAACGATAIDGIPHGIRWTPEMHTCPRHDLPICPACAAICATYLESRCWEGV